MKCEESCDKCTFAATAGRLCEQGENQHGIGDVQRDVRDMEAGCPIAEDLGVQHEREPGQRKPVATVKTDEAPSQVLKREPRQHVRVAGHIDRVVDVNEALGNRSQINGQCRAGQTSGNQERPVKHFLTTNRRLPHLRLLREREARPLAVIFRGYRNSEWRRIEGRFNRSVPRPSELRVGRVPRPS